MQAMEVLKIDVNKSVEDVWNDMCVQRSEMASSLVSNAGYSQLHRRSFQDEDTKDAQRR